MSKREVRRLKAKIKDLERDLRWERAMLEVTLRRQESPKEMVDSLLTGIAPLFLGYKDAVRGGPNKLQEIVTAMGNQGLVTDMNLDGRTLYPDVEFDDAMEGRERWPDRDGMQIGSHQIANGMMGRNDGQPMFTAGTTAPPPESATE